MVAIAWVSIAIAVVCALLIAAHEVRRPQAMAVMNVVWPVTALYFSVLGLWAYFALAARKSRNAMSGGHRQDGMARRNNKPLTLSEVAVGTSHCGAGCILADVITEFAIAASGLMLFGSMLWTDYLLDFAAAWLLGIVFQYAAIHPMRPQLSRRQAILAAIKADTLSILAFQVGMYLFMALQHFVLFPAPHALTPFDPRYWLMMQVAMICGFATSMPMNWWLIRVGVKEKM